LHEEEIESHIFCEKLKVVNYAMSNFVWFCATPTACLAAVAG
jgi:hypothetical protein